MTKNPYNLSYEEFVSFMNNLKTQAKSTSQRGITETSHQKHFSSKEEYMKYYGAISVEEYIKRSHNKYEH